MARHRGFELASYEDAAVGTMTKNERGVPWVSLVVLTPRLAWAGASPTDAELDALHEEAHARCFIACSVKTEIRVAR
jgi:organic hydroperoxide reductase OsmC/OhrA